MENRTSADMLSDFSFSLLISAALGFKILPNVALCVKKFAHPCPRDYIFKSFCDAMNVDLRKLKEEEN